MLTLADLIEAHEAHQEPAETPAAAVLTPRGHGVLAVVRLKYLLAELEGADRAYCLARLRDVLADVDRDGC
jgi:hypothetical protein